jgi:hypothetical protein
VLARACLSRETVCPCSTPLLARARQSHRLVSRQCVPCVAYAFAAESLKPISCSSTAVCATVAVQSHVQSPAQTTMVRGKQQEASKPLATSGLSQTLWKAFRVAAHGQSRILRGACSRCMQSAPVILSKARCLGGGTMGDSGIAPQILFFTYTGHRRRDWYGAPQTELVSLSPKFLSSTQTASVSLAQQHKLQPVITNVDSDKAQSHRPKSSVETKGGSGKGIANLESAGSLVGSTYSFY